jgi:hypothetical protein
VRWTTSSGQRWGPPQFHGHHNRQLNVQQMLLEMDHYLLLQLS